MPFATSPSSFSSLRPLILRLARVGTAHPIEVIVTAFCAVTLVYFQLLTVSPQLPSASFSGTSWGSVTRARRTRRRRRHRNM